MGEPEHRRIVAAERLQGREAIGLDTLLAVDPAAELAAGELELARPVADALEPPEREEMVLAKFAANVEGALDDRQRERVVEGLLQTKLPETTAGTVNNVMHWGYGIAWGLPFGIVAGSLHRPKLRHGPLFGTAVWLASYALLPPTGLYQPIWEYPPKTLGKDWASHLLYGTTAGAALRLLLLGRSRG